MQPNMSANDPKRTFATTVEAQTNAHCALNCRFLATKGSHPPFRTHEYAVKLAK